MIEGKRALGPSSEIRLIARVVLEANLTHTKLDGSRAAAMTAVILIGHVAPPDELALLGLFKLGGSTPIYLNPDSAHGGNCFSRFSRWRQQSDRGVATKETVR